MKILKNEFRTQIETDKGKFIITTHCGNIQICLQPDDCSPTIMTLGSDGESVIDAICGALQEVKKEMI